MIQHLKERMDAVGRGYDLYARKSDDELDTFFANFRLGGQ